MFHIRCTAVLLIALLGLTQAEAKPEPTDARATYGPDEPILKPVEEIEYEPGPASLPAGCEVAVLEGDPSAEGLFVMRLRLPDGYIIPPHSHPNFERITVLDGTFRLGHGSTVDREATMALEAGSFTSMTPGMRHFAQAEGETVIQITSIGPWEIEYVDPADDPRQE